MPIGLNIPGCVMKLQQRLDLSAQCGIVAAHVVHKRHTFVGGAVEGREKQIFSPLG
jgi:hypothetical protein